MTSDVKVRLGPDGVHLFSRRTGLNILADEMSVPSAHWSKAPRQVSIALTNVCDLHCPYCYAPKHRAKLNSETVQEWLRELDRLGCLYIGFGGGEPTLHPDLAQLCEFATTKTRLAVSFTTHAHRITEKLANDLTGYVNYIRVSMDGVDATYEALRGKSFESLRARVRTVKSIAPFGINFVVNTRTFPDIEKAIQLAVDMGASEFLLLPERPTSNSRGIDNATRTALTKWVANLQTPIRLAVSEIDAEGFHICYPFANEKGLRSFAHIDADGILKRSSFDTTGIPIEQGGILTAIELLQQQEGLHNEGLDTVRL